MHVLYFQDRGHLQQRDFPIRTFPQIYTASLLDYNLTETTVVVKCKSSKNKRNTYLYSYWQSSFHLKTNNRALFLKLYFPLGLIPANLLHVRASFREHPKYPL